MKGDKSAKRAEDDTRKTDWLHKLCDVGPGRPRRLRQLIRNPRVTNSGPEETGPPLYFAIEDLMDALTIENEETPREVCGSAVLDHRFRELFRLPRLVELRWLSAAKTFSLFTASLRPIEDAVANARLSGLNSYLVINPPRPDVLDRRRICPDVVFRPAKGQCCADTDIPEHVLLPFDFEPRRATGVCVIAGPVRV